MSEDKPKTLAEKRQDGAATAFFLFAISAGDIYLEPKGLPSWVTPLAWLVASLCAVYLLFLVYAVAKRLNESQQDEVAGTWAVWGCGTIFLVVGLSYVLLTWSPISQKLSSTPAWAWIIIGLLAVIIYQQHEKK